MPFQPLRDYAGFNHVLQAGGVWFHPGNGNGYACACEQVSGVQQDLAVYRLPAGANVWQEVKRYRGTVDSVAQFTWGSAAIGQGGAMFVVTSLIIPGAPKVTNTGFQGSWIREPNIDQPWTLQAGPKGDKGDQGIQGLTGASYDPRVDALVSQLGALSQQIVAIETALGNIGGDGLSASDTEALRRLKVWLGIE